MCSLEIDNRNMRKESLGRKGLHLNSRNSGKLAINFIKNIIYLQKNKKLYDAGGFQDNPSIFEGYDVIV